MNLSAGSLEMLKIPDLHNWIASLDKEVQDEITSAMRYRNLVDGEILYRLGEEPLELFQVAEGKVKLSNYSYEGKEAMIVHMLPGDCCGEIALVDGMPRMTNAIAVGTTKVGILSKEQFEALAERHPSIYKALSIMFCHRLRMFFTQSEDAITLSLKERLARLIHRIGLAESSGLESEPLQLAVSQEELGAMLGVSRQSISKELKQLERDGLIQVRYGKLFILDSPALSAAYGDLIGQVPITPDYSGEDS